MAPQGPKAVNYMSLLLMAGSSIPFALHDNETEFCHKN